MNEFPPEKWFQLQIFKRIVFVSILFNYSIVFGQTGQLTVISQPPGAHVWLDDLELGSTPVFNRDIKTGFYTIRLLDPVSNTEATRSVQIIADSLVSLNVELGVSTGFVSVESTPQGAQVALVTILGNTPLKNIPVNADDYSVRIEHPKRRYSAVVENITVEDNKSKNISVSLSKNKPYLLKTTSRIVLGTTALGCFSWGFYARGNDNAVGSIVGFALGTLFLVGVEFLSF